MDLDSFLVSLYVLVDDWWKLEHASRPPKTGRPALLSDSEVITLAILAQWPRFRSERDFWRFAQARLRPYLPALCWQSQLNRRIRALEPQMRLLQFAQIARELADPSVVYRVLDTTLVPAIVRVRASRKGLFAGQATFGRSRVYPVGFAPQRPAQAIMRLRCAQSNLTAAAAVAVENAYQKLAATVRA